MRFGFSYSTRVLSLALLFLSAVCSLAATNFTRAFNGHYQLSDVAEVGDQVEVTMTLTLANASKTSVSEGIVAVLSSDPVPVLIGSFSPIKTLPAFHQVIVSQRLTVSAAEFKGWQAGRPPRLQLLVSNGTRAVASDIQAYRVLPPNKGAN
jgi:hypothetical protein